MSLAKMSERKARRRNAEMTRASRPQRRGSPIAHLAAGSSFGAVVESCDQLAVLYPAMLVVHGKEVLNAVREPFGIPEADENGAGGAE